MPDPLSFSIITPSFNQGRFIKATLDSILGQDYPQVESIVMDGGSTDETVDILRAYADPRLYWVSEPDRGQADAINKGLRRAKGDILAYLNSDDLYLPGTLRYVADTFAAHPEVDVICGRCQQVNADGETLPQKLALNPPISIDRALRRKIFVPQPGVFWRRHVTEKIGLFDEMLHYALDHDYWVRMLLAGFKLTPISRDVAAFRLHGQSKTVGQPVRFWKDWQTIVEKVFASPDLSADLLALRPIADTYIQFHAAEMLLRSDKPQDRRMARQHAGYVIRHADHFRLRGIGMLMWVDSVFNSHLMDTVSAFYRTLKGS